MRIVTTVTNASNPESPANNAERRRPFSIFLSDTGHVTSHKDSDVPGPGCPGCQRHFSPVRAPAKERGERERRDSTEERGGDREEAKRREEKRREEKRREEKRREEKRREEKRREEERRGEKRREEKRRESVCVYFRKKKRGKGEKERDRDRDRQ
jgi:hypothetical protein